MMIRALQLAILLATSFYLGYQAHQPENPYPKHADLISLPEEICQAGIGDTLILTQSNNLLTLEFARFATDKSNTLIVIK